MEAEYIEIVNDLNAEVFERGNEEELSFNYRTNGFVDAIYFEGTCLWNSDLDTREWIDENSREPLIAYIKREFNNYANRLHRMKFTEQGDDK